MSNVESVTESDIEAKKRELLPHLYGFPWYAWAKEFHECTETQGFLCAANQISKSSTLIRTAIRWATDPDKWEELWGKKPTQFWYFYPDKGTATREFKEKWIKEFLPAGGMKDDPTFGWKEKYEYGKIHHVAFNSGVTIYFLSYEQSLANMQASSVYAMFGDEEMPVSVYDEAAPRLWATNGYFRMVFTATLGQEFWRRVIEENGEKEVFPEAFKKQVSMYECMTYADGSPSPWTAERIEKRRASCRNEAEVLRRIYGRFIMSEGLLYGAFEESSHTFKKAQRRAGWMTFAGVYRNAIAIVAVAPNFDRAELIDGWMAEEGEDVSALEVYIQYRKLTSKLHIDNAYADKKFSKDFISVAISGGSSFLPVKKPKDNGEKLVNSMFECNVLVISTKKALQPLLYQIKSVRRDHEELDGFDFVGAMLSAVYHLPWNFSRAFAVKKKEKDPYKHMSKRERWYKGVDLPKPVHSYDSELEMINEEHEFNGYEEEIW